MLSDNFYKNVLTIVNDDAKKLKDFFINSLVNSDNLDQKVQGKAILANYFCAYLDAISKWCQSNDANSSFAPDTFLPENNPSIMAILNPNAVKNTTDEDEDELND